MTIDPEAEYRRVQAKCPASRTRELLLAVLVIGVLVVLAFLDWIDWAWAPVAFVAFTVRELVTLRLRRNARNFARRTR